MIGRSSLRVSLLLIGPATRLIVSLSSTLFRSFLLYQHVSSVLHHPASFQLSGAICWVHLFHKIGLSFGRPLQCSIDLRQLSTSTTESPAHYACIIESSSGFHQIHFQKIVQNSLCIAAAVIVAWRTMATIDCEVLAKTESICLPVLISQAMSAFVLIGICYFVGTQLQFRILFQWATSDYYRYFPPGSNIATNSVFNPAPWPFTHLI